MSELTRIQKQAKTTASQQPARAKQPRQGLPQQGLPALAADRPDIAAQMNSASRLGHSLNDIRVERSASRATQPAANRTGLPDKLKTGIENLSGLSLDEVKVHYNSPKPSELDALAYTRGTEIHVAPGQEQHLPHEAWHVVQQKQSRVVGTGQQKGLALNESMPLEHEAEVMGAKAIQHASATPPAIAPLQVLRPMNSAPAIQMFKYVRRGKGSAVREVPDDYVLQEGERPSNLDAFLKDNRGSQEVRARKEQLRQERAAEAARKAAVRKQERAARRERANLKYLPKNKDRKQVKFPGVVHHETGAPADLVYRGMSVNNIRNLQKGKDAIFSAQAPTGAANALEHIVDDSQASPYLSFETGGLGISAGKYAAKPVHPVTRKPLGVTVKEGGFLKQEKSYTNESRRKYPKAKAKRIGYVGGIPRTAGIEQLDVSSKAKATKAFHNPEQPLKEQERQQLAIKLATADKEFLVKPGEEGIAPAQVPFVAKVKEVDEAYYKKHLTRQTSSKALGYYKSTKGDPVYSKIQIPDRPGNDQYKFNIHEDLRRAEDDSEDEMSDVESIDLEDYGD